MNSRKSKGRIRVLGVGLVTAVISFTMTGVAENTMQGMAGGFSGQKILSDMAGISASLAMPVSSVTYYRQDIGTSSQSNTDDPTQSREEPSVTVSQAESTISVQSQPEQKDSGPLVAVDAPVQHSTRLISLNIRKDTNDLSAYTEKDGEIINKHYGKITGTGAIDLNYGQLRNCTALSEPLILTEGMKKPDLNIELGNEPQVLIIHTHTTESYEQDNDGYYDTRFDGRSLCPANSVVGVGAALAQTLADNGICVIHDGTVFDDPLYENSYSRSRERIEQLLSEYPSIKIVLDIHRDGISDGDARIAPVSETDSGTAAQIMIICGCDDGSGILPDYMHNLRFAIYLQQGIERDTPGLTRPLLFDYRFYNQDLTAGSLVIEIGALGNSREQALRSARLAGESIASMLKELSE
ncbi:MAG: stage II sporulation protein P [Ruminiclostridium sp.]